ncbi:MAG: hypothetical protein H6818_19135 [Phycisphaerales bacterium]|nr:hypothetical protein [Phycisphaerales bacterium]
MFERRLRVVLTIPVLCGLVMLARLYRLQILERAEFREYAAAALIAPRRYLPPLRGAIRDRFGEVLVSDEPAYDLTVDYGALEANDEFVEDYALEIRRSEPDWHDADPQSLRVEATDRLDAFYDRLSRLSGTPVDDLLLRRDQIVESVQSLREYIWNHRREDERKELKDFRIKEQNLHHALMRDVTADARAKIEMALRDLPFVRIEPSVRRVWHDRAQPLCHILGRIGQVSSERIENDPRGDDSLAHYRAGDMAGTSGAELLAEETLRGTRGYEENDLDLQVVEHIDPIDGNDVRLTIDLDLQQQIASLLMDAVMEDPNRTGASCVILDVATREVLAMVSVPTFSLETFREHYDSLRDDTRYRPLLFRAVAEEYQPGSIMKPVALLAGFRYGLVDPAATTFCDGSYKNDSKHWHCWTYWRHQPGHGNVNAEEAIQHSCNIYFYALGERLNAHRLTSFYSDFVLGPNRSADAQSGTGLIEERSGIIPTQEWIFERRGRGYRVADGRNYAIGQGELQITPLQAANMYATLASGRFQEPTILADDDRRRPARDIPGLRTSAINTARRGLYRCVNEEGGTAERTARMENIVVCGKTGSAQCTARATVTAYTFDSGSHEQTILAPTIEAARATLPDGENARLMKRKIVERWPPPREKEKSPPPHAWFAAFAPYKHPRIAMALIIEYGGSGGQVAAPVGQKVLQVLLDSPHDYLGTGTGSGESLARGKSEDPS